MIDRNEIAKMAYQEARGIVGYGLEGDPIITGGDDETGLQLLALGVMALQRQNDEFRDLLEPPAGFKMEDWEALLERVREGRRARADALERAADELEGLIGKGRSGKKGLTPEAKALIVLVTEEWLRQVGRENLPHGIFALRCQMTAQVPGDLMDDSRRAFLDSSSP